MNRPVRIRRARADRSALRAEPDRATELVPIGLARRAHGVGGELLVQALGDTLPAVRAGDHLLARFRRVTLPDRSLTVRSIRPAHGGAYILALEEISNREDARRTGGAELCVPRSRLPPLAPGEFYRADLIGADVVTESGESIGIVHAFLDLPQHDVLVVQDGRRETLLPMVEDSIREIDVDARRIVVRPFLDEAAVVRRPSDREARSVGAMHSLARGRA